MDMALAVSSAGVNMEAELLLPLDFSFFVISMILCFKFQISPPPTESNQAK